MTTSSAALAAYYAAVTRVAIDDRRDTGDDWADCIACAFGTVDPDDFPGADVSASFGPEPEEIAAVRALIAEGVR